MSPTTAIHCPRQCDHQLPTRTQSDAERFCQVCDYPLFLDYDLTPKPEVVSVAPDAAIEFGEPQWEDEEPLSGQRSPQLTERSLGLEPSLVMGLLAALLVVVLVGLLLGVLILG